VDHPAGAIQKNVRGNRAWLLLSAAAPLLGGIETERWQSGQVFKSRSPELLSHDLLVTT
jgi:hypothetical protein